MINDTDAFLRNILLTVKTIAMVGASDKETRPSYVVFSSLLARGYQVIGVNPSLAGKSVHGAAFFKTSGGCSRADRYGGYFPQLPSGRRSRR